MQRRPHAGETVTLVQALAPVQVAAEGPVIACSAGAAGLAWGRARRLVAEGGRGLAAGRDAGDGGDGGGYVR